MTDLQAAVKRLWEAEAIQRAMSVSGDAMETFCDDLTLVLDALEARTVIARELHDALESITIDRSLGGRAFRTHRGLPMEMRPAQRKLTERAIAHYRAALGEEVA